MTPTPNTPELPSPAAIETPFQVLLHRKDVAPNGSFRPDASFVVTKALRTSGLWAHLAPEDGWALILLATFITPNGDARASANQLEAALNVPSGEARKRLSRLAALRWQGKPVVMVVPGQPSPDTFALSPPILRYEEDAPPPVTENALPYVAAGREVVVAESRERYARPKAEVERTIAKENGWDAPNPIESGEAKNPSADAVLRLRALGFERTRADELVARYGAARVHRQVDWLPYRAVRDPVRFLTAAIQDDYEAPKELRKPTGQEEAV